MNRPSADSRPIATSRGEPGIHFVVCSSVSGFHVLRVGIGLGKRASAGCFARRDMATTPGTPEGVHFLLVFVLLPKVSHVLRVPAGLGWSSAQPASMATARATYREHLQRFILLLF
jgi:hypothetical protein